NLDTAKQTKLTKEYTNKILAAPPEQRDALRQAAIAAGAFDFGGVTAGDLAVAQLLGTTQQNKLRDATWDDQVKAFKLANAKTIAETQKAQAEAANIKTKEPSFDASIAGILTNAVNDIVTNEGKIAAAKGAAMSDYSKGDPKTWFKENDSIFNKVPNQLVEFLQKDLKHLSKDLTPEQQAKALEMAKLDADLGHMLTLSDKGKEILKTSLEKSLNSLRKGEEYSKTAYANARIDSAIREVRARNLDNPLLTDENILAAMRLNKKTKKDYLAYKEEQKKKEQEEAERNLKSPPRKDLPKPSQQGSLLESIAKTPGLPNINLKPTDSLKGYLNNQAFANAGIGVYSPETQQAIHLNLAEQGKLDPTTADRYVTDLKAKLTNRDIDPMEKTYLEQMLAVFMKNQANGYKSED
ncbi:MAG: hypothetical protein KDH96_10115, partial [Candidatus Riesia sp.]|nr:hypothetical protein [Candidatus Riesia sp.]